MSETPQKKRSNNRNRNRNRNNNNRNRNRRPNNGKPRNNNRNYNQEKRAPKPVKLNWWQKILQAIGLYKAPTPPRKKTARAKELQRQEKASRKNTNKKREEKREPVTNSRLYIGNLSFDATESDLKDLFKGVGSVRKIEIVYHRQTHRSRGYGFIEMSNVEEAKRAVEVLHDQHFLGRKLIVNGAKAKKDESENESEHSKEKNLA